jgi:uncharacterized membrane protein YhaH (DUF805 family)
MESSSGGAGIVGLIVAIIYLAIFVAIIAGAWKMFTKAGVPGWMAIIPILNIFAVIKIAGKPGWWIILCLIPFVSFIIGIILCVNVAEKFGKGVGYAIGLILLPFIFVPMLGFGDAQYQGGPVKVL